MRLDKENTGDGLHLVPETSGIDVPSVCTIVIIAGTHQWVTVKEISLLRTTKLHWRKADAYLRQPYRET